MSSKLGELKTEPFRVCFNLFVLKESDYKCLREPELIYVERIIVKLIRLQLSFDQTAKVRPKLWLFSQHALLISTG